jgi:uncharacterized 2Fe-2S/4Fe-4S cluster protein (DUF4445 family)
MGMAAVNGAINHVVWNEGLEISVIGDGKPRGICGSGLLDALAVLLETGAVDDTGRLHDANEIKHGIAEYIGKIDGKNVVRLSPSGCEKNSDNIYMTAKDIRKLQLAKAAIAAGIRTLMHHAGVTAEQVRAFILAGGFGSFMDQYSAARIGMFPQSFLSVVNAKGNTAGEGAVLVLRSQTARATLEDIRKRCRYIELSINPVFNEQFVEQMTFNSS